MMNQKKQLHIYIAFVVLCISFLGSFLLWKKQHKTESYIQELAQELRAKTPDIKKVNSTEDNDKIAPRVKNWSDLPAQCKDSVVQVFTQAAEFNWLEPYKSPNHGEMYGSAFFISEEGDLITNAHVINQAKALSIQVPSLGKSRLDVDIIAVAPERDLALLRLQPQALEQLKKSLHKVSYLKLGNADLLRRGDKIMTLGYPLGQQFLKSTKGVVSGRQNLQTPMGQMHLIQIDAPINPGNSGGPSLNESGEVVGVNSMAAPDAQNVGWIIPSPEVNLFLRQVKKGIPDPKTGIILLRKPFLGIHYNYASENLTKFLGNPLPGGLYIFQIYEGSPLAKVGMKSGDMLYTINNYPVDVYGEMNVPWSEDKISLLDFISRIEWGDKISLTYYRNGKKQNANFILEPKKLLSVRRYFPGYEDIDYQVIGGLTVMELSINHIPLLLGISPELTRFIDIKNQIEPVLVITNLFPDSQAAKVHTLAPGTLIKEINNKEVKSLADFRKALFDGLKNDYLTIKTSNNVFAVLPMRLVLQDEKRLSRNYFYFLNETTQELIKHASI